MKKIIIIIVAVLLVLSVAGGCVYLVVSKYSNQGNLIEDLDKPFTQSENGGFDDGAVNEDGNTAENLKFGGLAAVQGDWVYYGKNGITRENTLTGEKSEIYAGQSSVSNIAVCGSHVYFMLDYKDIYRIRNDGTELELIYAPERGSSNFSFYLEDKYIYYEKETRTGSSSYGYTLVRAHVDNVLETEVVYSYRDDEDFVGVYEGYAVIFETPPDGWATYRNYTDSFTLIDVNTGSRKTVSYSSAYFTSRGDFHFDQRNIIYANSDYGKLVVYNIETESFIVKDTPRDMIIVHVSDGKYYYYVSGGYSNGYTRLDWLDGENSDIVSLGDESSLDYINVAGDKIYYKDRFYEGFYRSDTDGSNWEEIY